MILNILNVQEIKEIIESYGCMLEYLPPYSPDYNPIEYSFSVIKKAIRNAYGLNEDTSVEDLAKQLIQIAKEVVTREIAVNQFHHCGIDTSGLQ